MPMHDWTRVEAGVYHDFHQTWITHIKEALNGGVLPPAYYALLEQVAVRPAARVLTDPYEIGSWEGSDIASAGTNVRKIWEGLYHGDLSAYRQRKNVVTVREAATDRTAAVIELVSPGDKRDTPALHEFIDRLSTLLTQGVRLLVLDSFPPTPRDPYGFLGNLWRYRYNEIDVKWPDNKPLTLASFIAYEGVHWREYFAVGDALPDTMLMLSTTERVDVPLEATYNAAWRSVPQRWQRVVLSA